MSLIRPLAAVPTAAIGQELDDVAGWTPAAERFDLAILTVSAGAAWRDVAPGAAWREAAAGPAPRADGSEGFPTIALRTLASAPDAAPPLSAGANAFVRSAAETEITFIAGIDATGHVAGTSFGSWSYAGRFDPATYSATNSWTTKWGSATPGTAGGNILYYFDPAAAWTATEKAGLVAGLAIWSAEVNISFSETASAVAAQLAFRRSAPGSIDTYESFPNETPSAVGATTVGAPGTGAFITFDTGTYGWEQIGGPFSYAGGYAWDTVVHELGHFLGLGHGGPYNGNVNEATQQFGPYDSRLWSIMSYIEPELSVAQYYASYPVTGTSWSFNDPTTPMILDILAAQRLYGAATTGPLAAGNVHFGFATNLTGAIKPFFDFTQNTTPVVTLYAGGSNNTLDVSGFSQTARIDLHADSFSSTTGLVNNIGIADGVRIDHFIGGNGNTTVVGNDYGDDIRTGSGTDSITGGAGNDSITGGTGGDVIDGGLGRNTASFASTKAQTTLTNNHNGSWTAVGPDGTDTLRHIAVAHFTDADVLLPTLPKTDFGSDGLADILWRNNDGRNFLYGMTGTAITGGGAIVTVPTNWSVAGIGDLTGDGRADILWRNTAGDTWLYAMDGNAQIAGGGSVGNIPTNWTVAGLADFNGDGKADILWRDTTTGADWLYQMNGNAIIGGGAVVTVPTVWSVAGVADFTGDGKADILWRNTSTGDAFIYAMNGNSLIAGGGDVGIVPLTWSVAALGDFTGDGKADILWRNTAGDLWIYAMNGATQIAGGGSLGNLPAAWSIVRTGDFNGDGRDDILLFNTSTGQVWEWQMNGTAIIGGGSVTTVSLDWHIV